MATPSFQHALALHQAGDIHQAQTIYRAILDAKPNDAMALHYLGVSAHQSGHPAEALKWIHKSIAAAPNVADFHSNLGALLRDCGQLDEAAAALCTAIRLRPKYPEALNNLGDVLRQQGRLAEAQSVLRQAIAITPTATSLTNLGLVLMDRGRPGEAASVFRDALKLKPDSLAAQKYLGNALRLAGRLEEAVQVCRAAVAMAPDDADALFCLGNALRAVRDLPGAAEAYKKALPLKPDHGDLLINLAGVLVDLADLDPAIALGCRALKIKPDSPDARYNLSLALLMSGRLPEAWPLHESRWQCHGFLGSLLLLPQPLWSGETPAGRTIFVRAEQGCGDTIQFARYLALLAQRGAKVVLECQPELKAALIALPGATNVIARGEEPGDFDYHLPLLSLPYHFQTSLESVPATVPYISPDPARAAAWAKRLANYHGRKCGLVWAGNHIHRNDRNRSISPPVLAALSGIAGVQFFSLQKNPTSLPGIAGLVDLSADLHDFADTAAAVANLDLVISVDTSVAHLAGAMARSVWTMLPFAPDWRWMLGTDLSPWYPTMRLFRQPRPGDWQPVLEDIARQLRQPA